MFVGVAFLLASVVISFFLNFGSAADSILMALMTAVIAFFTVKVSFGAGSGGGQMQQYRTKWFRRNTAILRAA
jgi:hypothetical protein